MRRTIAILLLVVLPSAACTSFVPLGITPPTNPDRTPPLAARVHLDRAVVVDDGEGLRLPKIIGPGAVEGTVLRWNDERLRFQLAGCRLGPGCVVELSSEVILEVESIEPFSTSKWVALSAATLASTSILVCFFVFVWNPADGMWPQK